MIIEDENERSPKSSPALSSAQAPSSEPSTAQVPGTSLPVSRVDVQDGGPHLEPPPPPYEATTPLLGHGRLRSRRKPANRFVRALLYAGCIWLVGTIVLLAASYRNTPSTSWPSPGHADEPPTTTSTARPPLPSPTDPSGDDDDDDGTDDNPHKSPIPDIPSPHLPGDACIPASRWRLSGKTATTTFHLSPRADILRFDRIGELAGGIISISSLPPGYGDTIGYEVTARHPDPELLAERVSACVWRGNNEKGVHGVTLNTTMTLKDTLTPVHYIVRVLVPGHLLHVPGDPRQYGQLITDLPAFEHDVHVYKDAVEFESVRLNSQLAPVSVSALAAKTLDVQTSGFPITGNFKVLSSLSLKTVEGIIDVSVDMLSSSGEETSVSMSTTDQPIRAEIYAMGPHFPAWPGQFRINSTSTNARSSIDVISAPLGATLLVDARTTAANLVVGLPPTYEGSYDLATTLGLVEVRLSPNIKDPTGSGRRRKHSQEIRSLQRITGAVSWSLFPRRIPLQNSHVTLRTTLLGSARVQL